ncbi:hypothetical protein CGS53_01840 [Faecalibacterium prausnitzii]|nr:hypothetical protein CGS53_01840 [Faecalibacterium prausnitzii]
MLWDEPKIFFLERRYFFSIILSEFLKNRVALQLPIASQSLMKEKSLKSSEWSLDGFRAMVQKFITSAISTQKFWTL